MTSPRQAWAAEQVAAALERIAPLVQQRRAGVQPRLQRVLQAFAAECGAARGGPEQKAARALVGVGGLSARDIAERAMKIAGEICVYTNDKVTIESL